MTPDPHHGNPDAPILVDDPVCGMRIDPAGAAATTEHEATTVHFCSMGCHDRFVADPGAFTGKKASCCSSQDDRSPASAPAAAPADLDAIYICPMHPEVRQVGPGSCPICGMALEPESAAVAPDDSELRDMTRRFAFSAALSLPIVVLAMGDMVLPGSPIHDHLHWRVSGAMEFFLATIVVLWGGWPLLVRGVQSIRRRIGNMFTLITLGVGVAYLYSLVALLAPGLFPDSVRGADGSVGLYFEAAAVIVTLVLLGQVMELRARSQTSSAIRALLDLTPETAHRVTPGGDEDVLLGVVRIGDRLRVLPSETIPVDGLVIEGKSAVDASMVTGEPIPVEVTAASHVIGGTVNGSGSIVIEAQQVGEGTVLARIVRMVAEAQRSRAAIQNLVDRIAAWFVPAVIVTAVLAFLFWSTLGPEPRLVHGIIAAVSVLIIACPCALGLATPMSIMVASGRGASEGVLFRNADAIQALQDVDTLVVDKTGTLTRGAPTLDDVLTVPGHSQNDVLALAAALETSSEHPLARAVLDGARERGVEARKAADFDSVTGKGVVGTIEGARVALGNAALMDAEGASLAAIQERADALQAKGATVMFVATGGALVGALSVTDPIKPSTPDALRALRVDGLRIIMLTGDEERTARAVAESLGIDEVVANALPEDKLALIERLQSEGCIVAMAGDGINDAPALARANVGIAMGTGTNIAMESSDITLARGDLTAVHIARRLSRATMRNIRQNLVFAFGYNAAGIPIAAGALYPLTGSFLNPMIAAAAMSMSSVSVILNALRLRKA